jgi:hypothetical protein
MTNVKSEWVAGNLLFKDKSGTTILTLDGTNGQAVLPAGSKSGRKTAKTVWFNLDNGAGTTIDDIALSPSTAITISDVRAIYVDATTGTVAAGTFKVGTTVGGEEIVAATAYENTKTVGTYTAGTIVSGAVAANGFVNVRHTGVAATAAGQAYVQIEYTVD